MKFPALPAAAALTGNEIVPLTQAGVDRRTTTQAIANLAAPIDASAIPFSNSGFTADNVEDAIVEAAEGVGGGAAAGVTYDNSTSGLTADNVQEAIDELAAASGTTTVSIVTEASAATMVPATHAGLARYIRCAGDVTFDSAETYAAGEVYNIRATGSIELIEDGVTLTPPSGGTLELTAGMSVSVIMTSSTAGDVLGQTVPA